MAKVHIAAQFHTKSFCGIKNIFKKNYFMSLKMFLAILTNEEKVIDGIMCKKCVKKAKKVKVV